MSNLAWFVFLKKPGFLDNPFSANAVFGIEILQRVRL